MEYTNYMLTNRHLADLNPLIIGGEICDPGHSFGPAVRKYTLIHYVCSGTGILYSRGGEHPVYPGQAFVILPDEITTYTADLQNPWHYQWIGFDGALSRQFAALPPVINLSSDIFSRLMQAATADGAEYLIAAILLQLYAELFSGHQGSNFHVQKVESYIQASFMHPITVEQIAHQLNLDRRYLTRLFKEKTGQTIQDYLIRIRLKEACGYLRQGFTVRETATLCGYEDVSNFSRMFKRRYGISPAHWKDHVKNGRSQ